MSLPKGLNAKIQEAAMTVLEELGGVATVEDVAKHVQAMLTPEESGAIAYEGITKLVATRFRQTGRSGLPEAPAVDVTGTHMQLTLMSPEEYRFVITSCLVGKHRFQKRAEQYRDACAQIHGVHIDLAEIEAGIAGTA
ncbi:MAG TPA: hypothetical protein VIV12_02110 [Streptosporangiaceae bacterium]